MEKICLVYGGDSVESEISILTALKVQKELEKFSYPYMMVFLDHNGNFYSGEGLLNKENYHNLVRFKKGEFIKKEQNFYFKYGLKKEKFDMVLLLCHGYKSEDGTLGGYFDTLKIPCIYPGLMQSALLQDKSNFKRVMDSLKITQTKYGILSEEDYTFLLENKKAITSLSYPLVVKPSHLGSSIGVRKVDDEKQLIEALFDGFRYDDVVLIEEAVLHLKEVNVAIILKKDEMIVSDLERVNNEEKILSFIDKYDNYSFTESHIIPADIDNKIAKKIIYTAKKVYKKLFLKSLVRFDFLIDETTQKIYLNEINAIPGSLSYYLFENKDLKMVDLIDIMVEQFKIERIKSEKKITSYNQGFLSSLKAK